ncbi:hypothetical protein EC991_007122 [Linnemannia zychae]|nr:hypothetical protein EC991_007122 [Linnemannia zychae]
MNTATTTASSSGVLTLVQSGSRTACLSPEPAKGTTVESDHDAIWQVLVHLDRIALEARKDHILLAAEIEDLMALLEDHCHQLGLDPANITQLLILPCIAPITLTSRQTLFRACDDLYQDIVRRQERIERLVSRITTIAENIREPPELYLELERLHRFQTTVGMLRERWDQCAYLPTDDYDNALNRLFELAELQGGAPEYSYLRIEAPLCLSKDCLGSLSEKLASLDQNYYTRQSRIRAMEHVLGLIYQDLNTPDSRRVIFRNEATVKYAAELGRELKSLQLELGARKLYYAGDRWTALTLVWDQCFVGELERQRFRETVEAEDVTFVEKLERIQAEIEGCRTRYSKSGSVYKLMMTRSNHIERMIAFEQTASDPKRLFQSSFQLVEEEKFRRRAYPTLLKLENTLLDAIMKFEKEHEQSFMYEGLPYLETLQAEIENRHVNETVFAKFTPVIAAPTRSQTVQIMGRAISPIPAPPTISAPSPRPAIAPTGTITPQQSRHSMLASTRSLEASRRSNTLPLSRSTSPGSPLDIFSKDNNYKDRKNRDANTAEQENNPIGSSSFHRREASSASTVSVSSSTHSLRSKSSHSSILSQGAAPLVLATASTSPSADVAIATAAPAGSGRSGVGSIASYFGPISTSSMASTTLSPSSSSAASPLGTPSPKHESSTTAATAATGNGGSIGKSQRLERLSLPSGFKTPPTSPAPSQQQQQQPALVTGPRTLTLRPQASPGRNRPSANH